MAIKGFMGLLVSIPLAGAAIQQVGSIGALAPGIRSATQIGIGGGLLGQAASLSKKVFKF